MSRPIERTPEFRRDIVELALTIAVDSRSAALRFFTATEATLEQIARSAGLGELLDPHHPAVENL